MTTPPDWHAADAAYQLHHATCPTCRAAGAAPYSISARSASSSPARLR